MNGWMNEWMNKWMTSEWGKWVLCSLLLSQFVRKKNRQKCPGISEIELSKNDLYFQNISPFSNSAGSLYVLVTQSCPTLCHPMECSPPGSSVLGIFQARIQEWVAIPFSRGSSQDVWEGQTQISHLASRFFTFWDTREVLQVGCMQLMKQIPVKWEGGQIKQSVTAWAKRSIISGNILVRSKLNRKKSYDRGSTMFCLINTCRIGLNVPWYNRFVL